MGLNKSTGNMYEFITHTWNTIKGDCPHGCTYCYMKRWGKQKPPRFDSSELQTDLGQGNYIFVGSSCDMFAEGIPPEWITRTIEHCDKYNNKYFFQSKDPRNIPFNIPVESSICTTIETNRWYPEFMMNAPEIERRVYGMICFEDTPKYVTIEPIMDFDLIELIDYIYDCKPNQVNIGADSMKKNIPEPKTWKIIELIAELEKFTVVHQKSNLKRLL